MTTLALFGTSADPPTAGHQQILRQLSYQYDQVIAWASDNPLKTDQTPLVHRAAMLQLLVSDIEPPCSNIQCRQDLSYPRTIHTIERVQEEWSLAELTLVVGSDLIQQLPRWYQAQTLVQQVKLLVVPRPSYPIVTEDIKRLRQLGTEVAIAHFQGLPVSSTAYRTAQRTAERATQCTTQRAGATPSSLLGVTPPVHAYIMRERLYEHLHPQQQNTNVRA